MKVKSRNPLPLYLVTHTVLIEADDEHAAAQNAIDQIRAGSQIEVAVKANETTTTYVVVPLKPVEIRTVSADEEKIESKPKPNGHEKKAWNTSLLKRIFSFRYRPP